MRLKERLREVIEVFLESAFASVSSAMGGNCIRERLRWVREVENPREEHRRASAMPSMLQ